jgi:hypothetical protein
MSITRDDLVALLITGGKNLLERPKKDEKIVPVTTKGVVDEGTG